jgi:hypothetical protein
VHNFLLEILGFMVEAVCVPYSQSVFTAKETEHVKISFFAQRFVTGHNVHSLFGHTV